MEHSIEHSVGIYIGLLLLACLVGALTKRFAHVPYTVALTLVGLAVALTHIGPDISETGFGRELIFFVMLPPLLFHGALHLELNRLLRQFWPIVTFAVVGLLLSMFVVAGLFYYGSGLTGLDGFLIALLFGAMVTPTDPVSVLAVFNECRAPIGLRYIIEGESLFNDGVGIVVFVIVLNMVKAGAGAEFHAAYAIWEFVKVAAGGMIVGTAFGILAFQLMRIIEDHLLENAMCLVLAYGVFWVAEHWLHVSGVIATVMAGLMIGNYGKRLSMEQKTRETIDTFFESVDFLVNSFLFILIGLELQAIGWSDVTANLRPLGIAILALLASRAMSVYPLYRLLNLAGTKRPRNWAHVLYWGGLRGSIPIALLLGLLADPDSPIGEQDRALLLVCGFGIVLFSLVVQGLTMKPLLRHLGLVSAPVGER
ncbi:MAG: sodium:proton antiporter [Phycisphaerae bacterium]|nr:sodium:proton antiporter [Phycisphaerae bacterium]